MCQTANGCRVIGDLCQKTSDCCGGAGNGLPPDTGSGMTVCNIISGTNPPVGTCGNPTGCDPEGDVCGLDVNARHDCCGCLPPKINCCKKDSLGVSRCYGGSTTNCPNGYDGTPGCCIPTGQICTFTNECCAGNTCLPDSNGILHCTSVSCVPSGGTCTSTEDCCPGSICNLPPGSLSGTCGPPHVMDGGVCSEAGQSCSSTQPCCMGLRCDTPELSGSCPVGRTDCTCKILIP
ncbi:MAG TPA: hypothetical protein VKE22_00145 [Haliangiales bacterium]|nr:hypothetical protein [Haliangiales bacterium]